MYSIIIPAEEGGGAEKILKSLHFSFQERMLPGNLIVLKEATDVKLNNTIYLGVNSALLSFFPLLLFFIRRRPKVVISSLKHVSFITSFVCFILGIRHVTRVANTLSRERNFNMKWKLLIKLNHIFDHCVIAVSEGVKRDLVDNFNVNPNKIFVINNFVDQTDLLSVNFELKDFYNLAFVGRLEPQKNVDILISTLLNLPKNFRLFIVGDGSQRCELMENVNLVGLSDRVIFKGWMPDVETVLNDSDVLLLASDYEGFPNVLLEGAGRGLPIVAYDCGSGVSEVIDSSLIGTRLTKLAPVDFAVAIKSEVESDSALKRSMRAQHVRDNFSKETIIDQYVRVLFP